MFDSDAYLEQYIQENFYTKSLTNFLEKNKILNLASKIKHAQSVLILADYDVDGIVSSVIMKEILRLMGIKKENIKVVIPSRYDGYGADFNKILPEINKHDLTITVDNGSHESFIAGLLQDKHAQEKTIIIDHHPVDTIRFADHSFIINPNQDGSVSTCTGILVAFIYKCLYNLNKNNDIFTSEDASNVAFDHMDDLAAITAIADMVDLNNTTNRLWISNGIKKIRESNKLLYSKIKKNENLYDSLGFEIIPIVNSIGRLGSSRDINSIDFSTIFFAEHNSKKEIKKAFSNEWQELEMFNDVRKKAKRFFSEKALNETASNSHEINVFFHMDCPIGINGLVAQAMYEETKRPSIAISPNPYEPEMLVGSGRGTNLKNMLQSIKDTTSIPFTFGGHIEALGVQILAEHLEDFRLAIKNYSLPSMSPKITSNAVVVSDEIMSAEEFKSFADSYQKTSKGIPFASEFYIPTVIKEAYILKEYSDSGYCKARINDLEGLSITKNIKSLYDNELHAPCVVLKAPCTLNDCSLSLKLVERSSLSDYMNYSIKSRSGIKR